MVEESNNQKVQQWKRTNIGKYSPQKSSCFREKEAFRVQIKDKPREGLAEVTKQKNSCQNFGSTDHFANNCPKAKKEVYALEQVLEEESPTENFESESRGDAIREKSDENQDPREECLVEYQEEIPLEIQEIQLEAGIPQETANKNLCKHTQDSKTFLVTAMARNYLDHHFPNWEKQPLPTKAKDFKSASGKMTSIGEIIKGIVIPHRKSNIRLKPEFFVLEDAHIQGFLLGTDFQRMYGIDIYNSKMENSYGYKNGK
ncbi:hypothetical protein O181_015747 [Austropuccinia psidii MF-1]|uniref:Uncharacterized protein n=1 Tax=Austropuccinia psidii MF-1 TaxID=1389203 RepID=A0A9Q3C2P1_9BASI|nr:hypothetical protein [Austropuccinia psidii MF-1]